MEGEEGGVVGSLLRSGDVVLSGDGEGSDCGREPQPKKDSIVDEGRCR